MELELGVWKSANCLGSRLFHYKIKAGQLPAKRNVQDFGLAKNVSMFKKIVHGTGSSRMFGRIKSI
jgi:hypothetical protein